MGIEQAEADGKILYFRTVSTSIDYAKGGSWLEDEHPRDDGGEFKLKGGAATAPKRDKFEGTTGKQNTLFQTKGEPGQKNLFADVGMPEDMVQKDASGKPVTAGAEQPKAAPPSAKPKYEDGQVVTVPNPFGMFSDGPMKFKVLGRKGGKAYVDHADRKEPLTEDKWHWGAGMPEESLPHFFGDISGQVDVPPSDNPYIEAVRTGKAEPLGKGDDGVAFGVGDKVVKMSTTVPFHPMNQGHRTPAEAADMIAEDYANGKMMRNDGIPGIPEQQLKAHGDKAFVIMPRFKIPEKLTADQLDQVGKSVEAMHAKGWTINDQIQVGLDDQGNIWHFDIGKAAKSTDKFHRQDDIDHLKSLYRKSGVEYPNAAKETLEEWDGTAELLSFGNGPDEDEQKLLHDDATKANQARKHRMLQVPKLERDAINAKFMGQVKQLGLNPEDYFRPEELVRYQPPAPTAQEVESRWKPGQKVSVSGSAPMHVLRVNPTGTITVSESGKEEHAFDTEPGEQIKEVGEPVKQASIDPKSMGREQFVRAELQERRQRRADELRKVESEIATKWKPGNLPVGISPVQHFLTQEKVPKEFRDLATRHRLASKNLESDTRLDEKHFSGVWDAMNAKRQSENLKSAQNKPSPQKTLFAKRYAKDKSGHDHKGKGPGGGQFTGTGEGGGNAPESTVSHPNTQSAESLSDEVLSKMSKRLKSMGYDSRGAADVRQQLQHKNKNGLSLHEWHEDWKAAYEFATGSAVKRKETAVAKKDATPHVNWQVVNQLGTTSSWAETGYLRPDGGQVNLSGGGVGTRGLDHRTVGGTAGMQELTGIGYIRIMPGQGMDIAKEPTPDQYKQLRNFLQGIDEPVIDLKDGLGEFDDRNEWYSGSKRRFNGEYPTGTKPDRVINDIRKFYAGEQPQEVQRYAKGDDKKVAIGSTQVFPAGTAFMRTEFGWQPVFTQHDQNGTAFVRGAHGWEAGLQRYAAGESKGDGDAEEPKKGGGWRMLGSAPVFVGDDGVIRKGPACYRGRRMR